MRRRAPILIFGDRRGPLPLDNAFDLDAKAILGLAEPTIEAVAEQIAAQSGFLATQELRELLAPLLGEEDVAARVAHYITRLHGVMRAREQTVAEFFEDFEQELTERESIHSQDGSAESTEAFDEKQRAQLISRSKRLISESSPISRYWHARALAIQTGRVLEHMDIICDLRPVFGETKKLGEAKNLGEAKKNEADFGIDGMLPIFTLKLVVDEGAPLPTPFEVVLNEEQLSTLGKCVDRAQKQVAALYANLTAKSIAFPQLWNSQVDDDEDEEEEP